MSGLWVKVFPAPPAVKPELPGLGGWADISDAPTSTYTDGNGVKWNVWRYTANGTLNVTKAGVLDCFLLGGGGASKSVVASGSGDWAMNRGIEGDYLEGIHAVAAGALPVVVGAGGAVGTAQPADWGQPSKLGTLATHHAGRGFTYDSGVVSSITGSAVTYGGVAAPPVANLGQGHAWVSASSTPGSGSSGVVIVRRPA
jgi:hypothetical protein